MLNGKNYPMKPSIASCVPNGWVTRATIVDHASSFGIILGMPFYSTRARTLRERLLAPRTFFRKLDSTPNYSHYDDGVLYLTPDDYKAWNQAIERRTTDAA